MKAILIKQGYWSLVSGTEALTTSIQADADKLAAFTQRQLEAYSELILAIDDSQLAHMDSEDPKVIWDELAKVHGAQGLSTQLTAVRKFVRMKKKADQSMSSWIGDVRSFSHQMKRIDIILPDIFIIVVLTSGLPPEYEPVVVALDAIDSTKLTLDTTITQLLDEEERHISQKLMAEYKSPPIDPESTEDLDCTTTSEEAKVVNVDSDEPDDIW